MPGLGASKWAAKPLDDATPHVPTDSGHGTRHDRHVAVPPFGFTVPSTSFSSSSTAPSDVKPPSKADVAGEAAARRMEELLNGPTISRTSTANNTALRKPIFYQEQGRRKSLQGQSSAAPASAPSASHQAHNAVDFTQPSSARLHKLFNQWVVRPSEFYNVHHTLGLSDKDIAAIQKEIVEYRVQSAIAAGRGARYTAPWETPRSYMGHSKYAPKAEQGEFQQEEINEETDKAELDPTDPFGLGIVSSSKSEGKGRASEVVNLMD